MLQCPGSHLQPLYQVYLTKSSCNQGIKAVQPVTIPKKHTNCDLITKKPIKYITYLHASVNKPAPASWQSQTLESGP